jgi:hypothetical protein
MPLRAGRDSNKRPSLPCIVWPQHLLAGNGGLGRCWYFLLSCLVHCMVLLDGRKKKEALIELL